MKIKSMTLSFQQSDQQKAVSQSPECTLTFQLHHDFVSQMVLHDVFEVFTVQDGCVLSEEHDVSTNDAHGGEITSLLKNGEEGEEEKASTPLSLL